jgi:antitoxin component YwqK of YwqJK toxin-antitoxin module
MAAVGKVRVSAWIVIAGLLAGCGQEEVDFRQIQEVNGLAYKLGETEPFEGVIKNFPINALGVYTVGSCSVEMDAGLPDGVTTCSSNDGIKVAETSFREGKKEGIERRWNAQSGNLTHEYKWVAGYQQGEQKEFDPKSGNKTALFEMVKGKPEGIEKRWREDGTTIKDLTWSGGKKTGYDAGGQYELNYVDGKEHGEQKYYSTMDGEYYLSSVQHYDMGQKLDVRDFDEQGNVTNDEVFKNGIVQTRLIQRWRDGALESRSYRVNTDPTWSDRYVDPPMVQDGLEKYCDNSSRSCFEVQWEMGRPISGKFEYRNLQTGTNIVEYDGVPTHDGTKLVKHGTEIYSDYGYTTVIEWDHGLVTGGSKTRGTSEGEEVMSVSDSDGTADFFTPSGCYNCISYDRAGIGDPR